MRVRAGRMGVRITGPYDGDERVGSRTGVDPAIRVSITRWG
jgi:hypothetical protein